MSARMRRSLSAASFSSASNRASASTVTSPQSVSLPLLERTFVTIPMGCDSTVKHPPGPLGDYRRDLESAVRAGDGAREDAAVTAIIETCASIGH